jgi:diphthine-ammonia ligase
MEAAQLDARIIKVASAGLDEDHLWLKASSYQGSEKVKRALKKFGAAQGAALGEGGEFETLVLDGPQSLFQRRICVSDDERQIVREGGGTSWLRIKGAKTEDKLDEDAGASMVVRQPDLLDTQFQTILVTLTSTNDWKTDFAGRSADKPTPPLPSTSRQHEQLITKTFLPRQDARSASAQDQTSNIVNQTRKYLDTQDADAANILNTVILLRRMTDFPVVNTEYSKLFPRANPPSRVTISCGDALPKGIDITLALTMPRTPVERRGLHVQSRSYWAPANIGPYSQGITTSLTGESDAKSLTLTSIAGQIPLLPATMTLPVDSESSLQTQITLSLQHLWRIGFDMKVQFWSSAVAYFARAGSEQEMQQRTRLAGYAWQQANAPPAEEDDDADQLDPWDLKHNSDFMVLGDTIAQGPSSLPDWSVLPLRQQNDWQSRIPPVFAAEVESLPRSAEVEWHAHVGIGESQEGSAEVFSLGDLAGTDCEAWCMLARDSNTAFVHTTVAYNGASPDGEESANALLERLSAAYSESLQSLKIATEPISKAPYLVYLDRAYCNTSDLILSDSAAGLAVVPCHSLWAADGTKRSAVALFRSVLYQ